MSIGGKAAKRAETRSLQAADESRQERLLLEERRRKERERAQRLFIRQIRARQGGGFSQQEPADRLG